MPFLSILAALGGREADSYDGYGIGDIFQLVLLLLIMAAVIFAAYYFTRAIARGNSRLQKQVGGHLRVVERVMLAKDRAVVIIELDGRYYLLGVGESITMLCEVEGDAFWEEEAEEASVGGFLSALQDRLRGRPASPRGKGAQQARGQREWSSRSQQEDMERAVERMRERAKHMRPLDRGTQDGEDADE